MVRFTRGPRATEDMHPAEGTLDMQHSLLLQVARFENAAQGWSRGLNTQSQPSVLEMSQKKQDLWAAINTIWHNGSAKRKN
jgi:hypothetical protein